MDRRHRLLGKLPLVVGGLVGVLLLVGLIWFIRSQLQSKDDKPKREVQIVQVVRPPPPPPPPDEPPPPPPEQEPEIQEPEPEPAPADEAPAAEQLGLDADGTAGSDGFGLAARKGGRDITGSGGAVFAWYTGLLKERVLDRLSEDERVRTRKFSIVVRVWIASDGAVQQARVVSTSGNRDVDAAIEAAVTSLGRLREAPPVEMPQPISLRIVSRS